MKLEDLKGQSLHLLGIGGIGVSALARMLAANGLQVTGCDVRASSLTRALQEEGIEVSIGHAPEHIENNDVVVFSTAVPQDNAELVAARTSGKPLLHRSHLLGMLVDAHETIGVTGTNGKGTVCAMTTWILEQASLQPSFYIGGLCPNLGTNARETGGRYMVAELDESDGSLLNTHPQHAVINNVELDHLNYYQSLEEVVQTLHKFCRALPPDAQCYINRDDPGSMMVAGGLEGRNIKFFGQHPEADFQYEIIAIGDTNSQFRCWHRASSGERALFGDFELSVPGSYNIENAIAAIAVAASLGVEPTTIRTALKTFNGLENRYTVCRSGGRQIIKDYMSHPSGMRKVLATARLGKPRRLTAVFKPYRYTMIKYHAQNYADALATADEVIITRMWAGGEEPIPGVDTGWLVDQLAEAGLQVCYIPDMEAIADHYKAASSTGDCAVFFGGNDLFDIADELCRKLDKGEG